MYLPVENLKELAVVVQLIAFFCIAVFTVMLSNVNLNLFNYLGITNLLRGSFFFACAMIVRVIAQISSFTGELEYTTQVIVAITNAFLVLVASFFMMLGTVALASSLTTLESYNQPKNLEKKKITDMQQNFVDMLGS